MTREVRLPVTVEASDIEYPYTDEYGYYWYDSSGFRQTVSTETGRVPIKSPCFICHQLTDRIDIDYHGTFCNSDACNKQIDDDLRGMYEAAQSDASV